MEDAKPFESEGSTKVIVRIKPIGKGVARSISSSGGDCLDFSSAEDGSSLTFGFNRVLGECATQEDVYNELFGAVGEVLKGRNGTIISYGQTGSGKTHTLIGDIIGGRQSRGIVPRAAEQIFAAAAAQAETVGAVYRVHLSAVEIYCERIRDLLSFSGPSDNLLIQQDKEGIVYVAGAQELIVDCEDDVTRAMQAALSNRATAATGMNAASSRSHCLVSLMVDCQWQELRGSAGSSNCCAVRGKLCLVDLAGSERQDRTQAAGQTLEEGRLINKSLSALGNVVAALTEQRSGACHVPFRDSKLTRVLQDSLGGNAITAIIVCCSPAQDDAAESLSSLRFGARAAGIVSSVQTNHKTQRHNEAGRLLEAVQAECDGLRSQLISLEADLVALKAGEPGGMPFAGMTSAQHRSAQVLLWLLRSLIFVAIVLQAYVPL